MLRTGDWSGRVRYNPGRRKHLAMRNQRNFSLEFKRQVIEELLSGESGPAELCCGHNM